MRGNTAKQYSTPTSEEHRSILSEYSEPYNRLIREKECQHITSISRTSAWKLENEGRFPARKPLGRNSCAWSLSDLLHWVHNPPTVENVNTPYSRKSTN
nr:AlpA family phage regulatory protein [Xenorhabdus japonica]